MTRVVNGFRWIFSKEISPSSFSESLSTTFPVTNVCTCGICITSAAAKSRHDIATMMRQSILIALLMTFSLFNLQLAKIVKISEKIRIFADGIYIKRTSSNL